MLKDTLNKIEQNVRDSKSLAERRKTELVELIGDLRQELETLEQSHADKAQYIAEQAHSVAEQALDKDAETVELTSHGLERSIEEFELSHPKLYDTVKAFVIRITGFGV